jgi:hypothetical protein
MLSSFYRGHTSLQKKQKDAFLYPLYDPSKDNSPPKWWAVSFV